uniref:C2H2-type domain-containing protein n=1 Tax=Vombatus ursinus TaxID=29139 RepID=A0A4X2LQD9_VOMUR
MPKRRLWQIVHNCSIFKAIFYHEELCPFICEHAGCGKSFAMKQSLTRHAVTRDPYKRKLKIKVKQPFGKWSLASCLNGYIPPKIKEMLPKNGKSSDCFEENMVTKLLQH